MARCELTEFEWNVFLTGWHRSSPWRQAGNDVGDTHNPGPRFSKKASIASSPLHFQQEAGFPDQVGKVHPLCEPLATSPQSGYF